MLSSKEEGGMRGSQRGGSYLSLVLRGDREEQRGQRQGRMWKCFLSAYQLGGSQCCGDMRYVGLMAADGPG